MSHWVVPEHFNVVIGGNRYIDCPTIVNYRGASLFELRRSERDGLLVVNFDLHGSKGEKIATIRNGRFVDYQDDGYHIETSHDHFRLIETTSGRKVCEIKLRAKARADAELDVSAHMYMPDGRPVVFDEHKTNIGGLQISGSTFKNCGAAIRIE